MIDLHLGDCLEVMKQIPDKSVDAIICDLPYGTTACKWDSVIPFEPLWDEYKRICKGAIVLFASQPFTTTMIQSNLKMFKYELIWDKTFGRQPQLANIQPMKRHENIIIFGNGKITYNPQKILLDKPYYSSGASNNVGSNNDHKLGLKKVAKTYTHKTPDSVLIFKPPSNAKKFHPTQKPVDLVEYLVKTYTNEGDTVLDNCMGSGTAGVACKNLNRKFIGIEQDPTYFQIAKERINGSA